MYAVSTIKKLMSAVVAIVGRPNVGKSTLFNRIIGKRSAIESEIAGTTRDRLMHPYNLNGIKTLLVDTGGLELDKESGTIEGDVQKQSRLAIDGADLIVFMVDIQSELTSEDYHAADMLRKSKKPVLFVANKCDSSHLEEKQYHLYELGFGEPILLSAIHGEGISALLSKSEKELTKQGFEPAQEGEEDDGRIKIAFLGRPNVGKSTMINALFGKERVVVSEVAGTTRDATHIPFEYEGEPFTLIDTAGIRRRGKIEKGIEKYSVLRTLQSAAEADIAVLMMDFEEGLTSQDMHVSEAILNEKKGLILVVNKTDILPSDEAENRKHYLFRVLKNKMAYVPWAPLVFTSAKERKYIFEILNLSIEINKERRKTISDEKMAIWLEQTLAAHPPKGRKGKREFNVLRARQVDSNPPVFLFYCDWPQYMHFSYERYLENRLRESFGFRGTALELKFKRQT